ncbi:myosin heavy chain, embryonic smooth muscle isoform-like [Littorina saxatilis]|uniref:myosin heavy chain, embryonic smooth muscle isoform-like n=1 Tax=Littorina saxatilis TaxID=31220 RepID=UPI0038B63845
MATASLSVEPDEMECSVCHEHFKEPKVIPCGHMLCRHCLLSWLQSPNEALCPLCRCPMIDEKNRKSANSLADIADDFLTDRAMSALVEAHRLLSEQHVCCVCDNVAAVSICMDCRDMFCQQCTKLHKKQAATKLHNTEKLTSLTEEKLAANYRQACAVHSDKLPEVFCPAHKVSVCLRCATTVHRQCPDVKDLEERVGEARDTLHDLTAILTARETEVGQKISHLDKQLTDIDQQKQAAVAELTATFDDIEKAEKASLQRLNDLIVKTSADEKQSVSDVKNNHLSQRGKLTLHKRLVARSEAIITRDDVTDMTPEMETLVKDLDRSISSKANIKVTSRIELAIDPAEVTRIKKALSELGKGKGSSFDDGTTARMKLLEQNVQQQQRDLTSAQSERAHFAQQVTALQQELAGERHRVQVLEQEVKRKDDQIKRNGAEIASCKDDILSKVKEIKLLEQNVQQQQRDLTSAQSERARFARQVTALQQELAGERHRVQVVEQEVNRKDDQIKRNGAEIASCKDDILSKVKEMEQQELMHDQLQTELQAEKARQQNTTKQLQDYTKICSSQEKELRGEKTRHQNTTKQLQDYKQICSSQEKELQGEKTRHQNTAKQLQDSKKTCSSLEHDVASYQFMLRELSDKAPARETSVTQPSRPTHPQNQALRFHDNHGGHVVLSNNHQTAVYEGVYTFGGIVMSRDPLEVNKLYEQQWSMSLIADDGYSAHIPLRMKPRK